MKPTAPHCARHNDAEFILYTVSRSMMKYLIYLLPNYRNAGQKAGQVASIGSCTCTGTCIVGSRGEFGGAIPTVPSDQFQGAAVAQNKEGRPQAKCHYILYTNKQYFAHSLMALMHVTRRPAGVSRHHARTRKSHLRILACEGNPPRRYLVFGRHPRTT